MKNKVLKTAIAVMLIIAITMVDFVLVGMELITYALENIDNTTNNSNVKFAAYFKTDDEESSQIDYQIDNDKMKLYMEVSVVNSGYFDGVIILENSNFIIKPDSLSKDVGTIEGNIITLNRVRSGNTVEIEVEIEPIIAGGTYLENALSKESTLKISGNYYQDDTDEGLEIETSKKVILSLIAPTELETTLNGKLLTNRIYKIGEENKRIVQIELNSTVVENAYPIKSTTFEIDLPDEVEVIEVISKGTYATNGEADRNLAGNINVDEEKQILNVLIENPIKADGKISWEQDANDNIIVTLILDDEQEIEDKDYKVKSKVQFYGKENKTIEKEITFNINKEADGIIRTSVENIESIYKGKLYSKEDREYNSTTNIEINYANLIQGATIQEKTTYRIEKNSENIEANIQYKTTTISKAEIDKILGEKGILSIKDKNGKEISTITKETKADENGNIVITYAKEIKEITVEITKPISTGIIRLNHTKVIKGQELSDEEIDELKYLVEEAKVKYNTAEYSFEKKKELKEIKTEVSLTVEPQTLSAEESKEMQISITLKTDNEKYELFDNPTFTLTMPEGVKINSLSDGKESVLYGGLELSKLQRISERKIKIEISGKQTEYVKSDINTQIKFTANVSVEKLMPNKVDTINMEYQNRGNTYEDKTQKLNIVPSNSKIVTHLKLENYDGKDNVLEKYSDNKENLKVELQVGNKNEIEVPIKYTVINNYKSSIALTPKIEVFFTDKDENVEELIKNNLEEIIVEAGKMKTIEKTLKIPAKLYYSEKIEIETSVTYTYSGTEQKIENNLQLATEEKNGNRDIIDIENKIKVETFSQLGDGTALRESDEVYNEQIVKYIIKVTNTSEKNITNLKITNKQDNGKLYDLKEIWMQNLVISATELFLEHRYAELDTNTKVFEIATLKPGESKELVYEIVVKKTEESNITSSNITMTADDMQEQKLPKISNNVKDANLKMITEKALNEEVIKYGRESVQTLTYVKNLTNNEMKNLNIQMYLSNGLTWKDTYTIEALSLEDDDLGLVSNVKYNEEENYLEFIITKLEPKQEINISVYSYIKPLSLDKASNEESVYAKINNIVSNATRIKVEQQETKLSVSQSVNINEEQKVKDGEKVIITGTITNTGYTNALITIEDDLPKALEINKVEVIRGNDVSDETKDNENSIYIVTDIAKGETITLKIEATLNTSKTIQTELTNKIHVMQAVGEGATSNEITIQIESNVDTDTGINKPGDEEPIKDEYTISGHAWIDKNKDGIKDKDEAIKNVVVKIIDLDKNNMFVKDKNGNEIEVITDENGAYELRGIPKGNYNVIFKYDTSVYELKENTNLKDYIIDNSEEKVAITNNINLEADKTIDLELIELTEFNLKIDKYISKVVVQNSNGTKTSTYTKQKLAKEEIQKKYLKGSIILVEYTMQISNIGELAGYATEIIDYLPEGTEFHSELNKQWYTAEDGNLYNTSLASTMINPGETKTVKLILSKTMTNENIGTTSNIVEISETMNSKGYADIDSNNNQSTAEIMINIATGTVITYLVAILNSILILLVGIYVIKRNVIGKENK